MASKLLVLSGAEVGAIIEKHLPINSVLENQASVFKALHARLDEIDNPLRTAVRAPNHTGLFMPSRLGPHTTCKVVCVPNAESKQRGLPASTMLLDGESGRTRAFINAAKLTALRTAAGSMLPTRALEALRRDEGKGLSHVVLFGAGQQAVFHALLLVQITRQRSDAKMHLSFVVRKREEDLQQDIRDNLDWLRHQAKDLHVAITVLQASSESQVEAAVRQAEVLVSAVPSTAPLFPSSWVASGTHVILIGSYKPHMQEVETSLIHRAKGALIVDDADACAHEAGDLIKANVDAKDCISLGALLSHPTFSNTSKPPSRDAALKALEELGESSRDHDISLFKSVGVGLQDVAITSLVVETAETMAGIGTRLDF